LRIGFLVLRPRTHLREGPVILRASQRQHLLAPVLVPPGSRAFQTDMADACVRRCHAAAPQRRALAAKRAVVSPAPMVIACIGVAACGKNDPGLQTTTPFCQRSLQTRKPLG